jgi:CMP-N,N'-diacetyllegionaminic acid synthase
MKILAIIPARSGSKGLIDKNIKDLCGKPLIAYTIESALNSKIFTDVVVSTDSQKYAEIALKYGALVPFLRSKDLAKDETTTIAVIKDVLAKLHKNYDAFMILQPTSPLRTAKDIQNSLKLFKDKKADSIISVCKNEHPVEFSNNLNEDLKLDNFIKTEVKHKRRQDFKDTYRFNGAIYLVKIAFFQKTNDLYGEKSFAYIMPKERSIDIDDEIDFVITTALLNRNIKL